MGYKISKAKFRKALSGTLGIITTIAKKCGVRRLTVYRLMAKYPELKEELEVEKDKIIDRAESVLFEKVNDKDWRAIEFILSRKGGSRGYVDKKIIDTTVTNTAKDFQEAYKELGEDEAKDSNKTKEG